MQGYGETKALAGIQASGANGVITLSRSDKSGRMPSLGSDEKPVRLRAGPGVRLHGYGGIHTLERIQQTPEDPPTGTALLEWEVETFIGYAKVCSLSTSETGFVIVLTDTFNYTGGSIIYTSTASGVITAYAPGDPAPDDCADIVYEDNFDGDIEYGDYVSETHEETTVVSFATAAASAIAALAQVSSSSHSQEWDRNAWRDVSEEVTPFTVTISAGGIKVEYSSSTAQASNVRFRLRNRGNAALRVDCGFYGSGDPGGATDIESVIDLAPGSTSAWQEVPSIDPDPAKYYSAQIRRVRIGRWRLIA
jgi:hypothetical protein